MPTLEVALEGLIGTDLGAQLIVNATTDKVPLVDAGGAAKYATPWRIANVRKIDPTPLPVDTTLDTTGTDGDKIEVTGVDEVTDITMGEDTMLTFKFTDGGSSIDDSGNILGVPNGSITVTEGMEITVFRPAGGDPTIVNIYEPQSPLTLASATPVALLATDTVMVYRPQWMLIAGSGVADVDDLYIHSGRAQKRQQYIGVNTGNTLNWTETGTDRWRVFNTSFTQLIYSAEDVATPDLATDWYDNGAVLDPGVTVTASPAGAYLLAAGSLASSTRPVTAKTSDYVVVIGDDQTIFTNTGAGGTVKFTLPANASCEAGKTLFTFEALDAQIIQVEPASGSIIIDDQTTATITATNGSPAISSGRQAEFMTVEYRGSDLWIGRVNRGWTV